MVASNSQPVLGLSKQPGASPPGNTPSVPLSLEQRILAIRAEIDAVIDAKAAAVAKESPGTPLAVIRMLVVGRQAACPCAQYFNLTEDEKERFS